MTVESGGKAVSVAFQYRRVKAVNGPARVTVALPSAEVSSSTGRFGWVGRSGEATVALPSTYVGASIDTAEGSGSNLPITGFMRSTARYLYQKVNVLAIGSQTELSPGEQVSTSSSSGSTTQDTGNTGIITFNVTPVAAQWIASAQASGSMYLSLVPEDYAPRELAPLDPAVTLLPGEDPAQLTPYGPAGASE